MVRKAWWTDKFMAVAVGTKTVHIMADQEAEEAETRGHLTFKAFLHNDWPLTRFYLLKLLS